MNAGRYTDIHRGMQREKKRRRSANHESETSNVKYTLGNLDLMVVEHWNLERLPSSRN